MHLIDLFPTSFPPPPLQLLWPVPEGAKVVSLRTPAGECWTWIFDDDPGSLPAALDSIFTAAAEHEITFDQACFAARNAIRLDEPARRAQEDLSC